MSARAQQAEEIETQRREAGLGGFMRRAAASTSLLRGKAVVAEEATMRPFREPPVDADAMLARKVAAARAKLVAAHSGVPPQE